MRMQTYGFCGFIGSGKDAAAAALIEYSGAAKYSFAGLLKDIVATLFSWDRAMLDGTTQESRQWREKEDVYWSKALGRSVTPRSILQVMGTEVFRNFHKDFWISALLRQLMYASAPTVIFTDARFGNELEFVHQQEGTLVWISRPEAETALPEKLKEAVARRRKLTLPDAEPLKLSGIHASEVSFLTEGADKLDVVILNNARLDDLTACVRHFQDVVSKRPGVIPIGDGPTIYLERAFEGSYKWTWQKGEQFNQIVMPDVKEPVTV